MAHIEPKELNMNNSKCIHAFTFTDYTTPLHSKISYSLYNKDNKPVLVVENMNTCFQTKSEYSGDLSILYVLDEEVAQWDGNVPRDIQEGINAMRTYLMEPVMVKGLTNAIVKGTEAFDKDNFNQVRKWSKTIENLLLKMRSKEEILKQATKYGCLFCGKILYLALAKHLIEDDYFRSF